MNYFQHRPQELPGRLTVRFVHQPRYGKLAGSVNRNKEIELAFIGAQFRNIPSHACKHALPGKYRCNVARMACAPLRQSMIALPVKGSWHSRDLSVP